ncbi:MAG: RdgB/HAM1 family non-canonical purine NTP pyrophosphatase [Ilumatobacteraceae bacterium]|nr:RdgB/HAM1 family non-canonical purine NTP pyrophosphatase [Ilumatobacteraceae bacterium]
MALQLVCASANPGKVAEIEQLMPQGVSLLPRPTSVADVVEDASTLVGNARLKARAIVDATGCPALADDTGLFVDALNGLPGVRTARYAGEEATDADNKAKLLAALENSTARTCRFITAVVVLWPNGDEVVVEGVCEGSIALRETGNSGFGFDALFIPAAGDGRTFAEMQAVEKNAMSHRGRAFVELAKVLTNHVGQ